MGIRPETLIIWLEYDLLKYVIQLQNGKFLANAYFLFQSKYFFQNRPCY